jgi:hypothetical protein
VALDVIQGGRASGAGSVTDRAVTPVRYDAAEGSPPPAGGAKVLRCALDWMTVLCFVPVSRPRWAELRELAARRVVVIVPSATGPLPIELYTLGKDVIGKSTAGVRFLLREPDGCSMREPATCTRSEVTAATVARLVASQRFGHQCADDERRAEGVPVVLRSETTVGRRCSGVLVAVDAVVAAGLEHRPGDDVRAIYGCEVQIQGAAFSSVATGGDELVADVWRALAGWLYAGRWADTVATLDPFTHVGRFDVATDTAFTADPDGAWVTEGIYANGSHTDCFRRFSSRARKVRSEETVRENDEAAEVYDVPVGGRRALLGKATAGRTLYMGSASYVLLCIYERSKKRDGDWPILEPTLRRCGWDGTSEVIRTEFRGSRKWLGDQVVRHADGRPMFPRIAQARGESDGLNGAELTLSQFLRALPSLVVEFPSRFRHTDPAQDGGDGPRVRDRLSSAWWVGIEGAARHWSSGGGDVGRVVSTRRHAAAERTTKQIRTSLVRLVALSGGRSLSDVLPSIFDAWREKEFADQRDLLIARQRARYAVPIRAVAEMAATG